MGVKLLDKINDQAASNLLFFGNKNDTETFEMNGSYQNQFVTF